MTKKYYINRHAEQLDMPYNDDDSQRLLQAIDEVVQTHEPESEEEVSRLVERLAFEWKISPTILNLISQSYWRGLSLIHISDPRDQRGSRMPSSA